MDLREINTDYDGWIINSKEKNCIKLIKSNKTIEVIKNPVKNKKIIIKKEKNGKEITIKVNKEKDKISEKINEIIK